MAVLSPSLDTEYPTSTVTVVESPVATGRHRRSRLRRARPAAIAFVVVFGAWSIVAQLVLSGPKRFLLPAPWSVIAVGFDHQSLAALLPAFGRTSELVVTGLVVALAVGIGTGTLLFRFGWLERASFPYLVALQAVPVIAVAPLMGVAFGYNFFAKLLVVVIIAFFPIPTAFLVGLKSVDRGLVDLFALHRAGWWTRFFKMALPSSLPQLFTGFRISAGLSVIGAIVGEQSFQAGKPGLGMLIIQYVDYVEYDQLYAVIFASSLLGIAFFFIFTWLSRRLFGHWHESIQADDRLPTRAASH
jgi:NitT/TauT family transport system permease protein